MVEVAAVMGIIYFSMISKYWQPYIIVILILQVMVAFASMLLPESPVFYFAKGKETESKNEILKFAKKNGKEMEDFKLKVDQQLDKDPETKDKS
jgi:hypothetical protein